MSNTVIITVGLPSSGKTTLAGDFKNYKRLNRDTEGGKIVELLPKFIDALTAGNDVILDNTFISRQSRQPFLQIAKIYGAKIICYWFKATPAQCQYNASKRMLERYGKLLSPEEINKSKDPNIFPPHVIYKFAKELEAPDKIEGFDEIIEVEWKKPEYRGKSLFLDIDDTLRKTVGTDRPYPIKPSELELLPGRREKLQKYVDAGYLLLGISNQSGIYKGIFSEKAAVECFNHTINLLGLDIDILFCPHTNEIACYCRKPNIGHIVKHVEKYKLNIDDCIFCGDQPTDRECAERIGIKYFDVNEFFI